jgi:hypothetical protein
MDNVTISDASTTAFKEGLEQGIEIARQMLCNALGQEIDNFGRACAHVDKLMWEKARYEKATINE